MVSPNVPSTGLARKSRRPACPAGHCAGGASAACDDTDAAIRRQRKRPGSRLPGLVHRAV